jgi:hypothetical protein
MPKSSEEFADEKLRRDCESRVKEAIERLLNSMKVAGTQYLNFYGADLQLIGELAVVHYLASEVTCGDVKYDSIASPMLNRIRDRHFDLG